MSAYLAISKEEMSQFMTEVGFRVVDLQGTNEIVYGKVIKKDITLRIYSSIPKYGTEARKKGGDAIRCLVVKRFSSGNPLENTLVRPIMKKAKKVYRVMGWKVNLLARIVELTKEFGA